MPSPGAAGEIDETEASLQAALDQRRGELDRSYADEAAAIKLCQRLEASEEATRRRLAAIAARRCWLDEEIERLNGELGRVRSRRVSVERIEGLRESLSDKLQSATPETRRCVLDCLDARINVWPQRVEVELAIPLTPSSNLDATVFNSPSPAGNGAGVEVSLCRMSSVPNV